MQVGKLRTGFGLSMRSRKGNCLQDSRYSSKDTRAKKTDDQA